MGHPRYCLAHYCGIFYNMTNATDFTMPPTPVTLAQSTTLPMLAQHPPHPRWCVTHTSTPTTEAMLVPHPHKHATNATHATTNSTPFLKLGSSLISAVFYFIRFCHFFGCSFLSFLLITKVF